MGGFAKLAGKIERQYEKKGYSAVRARYIAKATAGKIAREKAASR